MFWYPVIAKKKMAEVLDSVWGRLFANWGDVSADEQGYASVGDDSPQLERTGLAAFLTSFKVLWTCLLEAPEVAARRRTRSLRDSAN